MARSANAAITKLAVGIVSVAALAGITGRLSAGRPVTPGPPATPGGTASIQQDQPPTMTAPPRSERGLQGRDSDGEDGQLFGNDDNGGDEERDQERDEEHGGQGFALLPPSPGQEPQFLPPTAGLPSQPSFRSRTRTHRS